MWMDIEQWIDRVELPIAPGSASATSITREGNIEGPLHGEVMVFTGALEIPRREAADLAAEAGCQVVARVTKKTTILVDGDQDVRRLAGHKKSSKHRKAGDLLLAGNPIRILGESDFRSLISLAKK
jgi:DNA polymerase-3 subunit epsilon